MKPTNTAVSPPGRLGRFKGLNPDEVKAFRNLVRSSDGLQYGISVVEAQMSLSSQRPKREGTQGDGCIRRPREMPGFTP